MDRWYRQIERTGLYGAFLRHCVWAIAPFEWRGWRRQTVVLRILALALLWCCLPEAAVLVPAWFGLQAFGIDAGEAVLVAGAIALGFAMVFAPIVPRALLMPLAWLPAMGALALGNEAPAARIDDEARTNYDRWSARLG